MIVQCVYYIIENELKELKLFSDLRTALTYFSQLQEEDKNPKMYATDL